MGLLRWTAWAASIIVAFAANLMNNLPVKLIAGNVVQSANASDQITSAILIGVDLGPNLYVTASLPTILWLAVLRREEQVIGATVRFLKPGFLVTPPALLLALAGALLFR